jgi:hypothetical protein
LSDAALGMRGFDFIVFDQARTSESLRRRGTPAGAGVRFDPLKDLDPGKTAEVGIIRGIDSLRNCVIKQEILKRNDRAAGRVARAASAPDRS